MPQDGTCSTHRCAWNIVVKGTNVGGEGGGEGCGPAAPTPALHTVGRPTFLMLTAWGQSSPRRARA